jgi:pimeloyl-ACP methyl ester carboxylesterase
LALGLGTLVTTLLAASAVAVASPFFRANGAAIQAAPAPTTAIVIGFVGGFVRRNSPHHGPVELAQRIRGSVPGSIHVEVFENRRRSQAHAAILRLLDTDHDGTLSAEEKSRARIVLYGHSWGAAAVVLLARDLRREHIPVLLTVQVDSVAKLFRDDSVIPDNVAAAVNFYQPHGLLHGLAQITAADRSKTAILGNFRTDYRQHPVECPNAPWNDRFFAPGHMQSECDPKIWSQVENLVLQRVASPDAPVPPGLNDKEVAVTAGRR